MIALRPAMDIRTVKAPTVPAWWAGRHSGRTKVSKLSGAGLLHVHK